MRNIKINYDDGYVDKGIRDTIVAPTYTPISEDAW